MNISTLCDKIELQTPVKEKVFATLPENTSLQKNVKNIIQAGLNTSFEIA
jgi:hypothetical protein